MSAPGATPRDVDALVVGGGIVGCACAYELARAGVETLLVEADDLNRRASGTNAGNIHLQGFDPALNPWGEARWRALARVHALAAARWRELEAELDADLGVVIGGGVMVAESVADLELLERKCALEREAGIAAEIVDRDGLAALFPQLGDALVGAQWCPDEGFANPLLAAPAFARAALAHGAAIRTNEPVEGIRRVDGGYLVTLRSGPIRAARVIDAAGARAGRLAAQVGLEIETGERVLTMNVTEPWPATTRLVIQHVKRRLTLKQAPNGTFLIGGGWPGCEGVAGPEADPESVAANLWTARHVMPSIGAVRLLRSWGARIPTMEDRTAIVGESARAPGFFVAAADITGFTLGPLIGAVVAELVTGRAPSADLGLFHPDLHPAAVAGAS
jgi:glycine/D-amino acid oxidase-like deaminating enzyme